MAKTRTVYDLYMQIGGKVQASLGRTFGKANNQLSSMQKTANNVNNSFRSLGRTLTTALAIFGGASLGVNAIKMAGQLEQYNVAFETLLGNQQRATKLMNKITKFAAATPFQLPDLVTGSKRLLAFGINANVVVDRLGRLGDLSQGSSEILNRLTLAYGKIKAKGKASLEELNMLTEAGVPIMAELSRQQKVSTNQLFKMISKGKIGYPQVEKAVVSLTSKGGKFYQMTLKQSKTLNGVMSTLSDAFNLMGARVAKKYLPQIKSVALKLIELMPVIEAKIIKITNTIDKWKDRFKVFIPTIIKVFNFFKTNIVSTFLRIQPILMKFAQENLPTIISIMKNLGSIGAKVMPILSKVIVGAVKILSGALSGLLTALNGVLSFVDGVFSANWKKAWEGILGIFQGIWKIITETIKIPFALIESFAKKQEIRVDVKVNKSIATAQKIPAHAAGTNFAPGGLTLVGERGPELVNMRRGSEVTPADRTKDLLKSLSSRSTGGITINAPITINGNADANDVRTAVSDSFRAFERKLDAALAQKMRLGRA